MTKNLKRLLFAILVCFLLINGLAVIHGYKFTHFSPGSGIRTKGPEELNWQEKIATIFTGVANPKPRLTSFPLQPFKTIRIVKTDTLEAWQIPLSHPKGTVILFHGYAGCKSDLLGQSAIFNTLGYNTILVDFAGSGGSTGMKTTLGINEAEEVRSWVSYVRHTNPASPIFLYGVSMGAVSILRSESQSELPVNGIILECPFESMLSAIKNRFDIINLPSFFFAELLAFWGGVQNGFWAFIHNSVEYAKHISCPTLLFYGMKDRKVTNQEIQNIFSSLPGSKELVTFDSAGHDNDFLLYPDKWTGAVSTFLCQNNP